MIPMGGGSDIIPRRLASVAAAAVVVVLCGAGLRAADLSPAEIIRRFSAKESEFKVARQSYTYRTRMTVQVLDRNGDVSEERALLIETYFTNEGTREQRTLLDEGGLRSVILTQEDIDDAANIQPFVLTAEDLPEYDVEYRGKEKADELDTYVFSVKPRHMEKGKRYFEGKIWVDDQDFQIVKTDGRAVPQTRQSKFPRFETIRQMIDKKYWFPVWTMADERLKFEGQGQRGPSGGTGLPFPIPGRRGGTRGGWPGYGSEVHIREIITYEDYKKFEVKANIKFGTPSPQPPP
jgi:outer membrane lipoprotein-sorting protein